MKFVYFRRGESPLENCIADVSVDEETGIATLHRVHTTNQAQGKGFARRVMQELLDDADRENVTIQLEINPYGPMDFNQLRAWYERLGFVWDDETSFMTRCPKLQK